MYNIEVLPGVRGGLIEDCGPRCKNKGLCELFIQSEIWFVEPFRLDNLHAVMFQ